MGRPLTGSRWKSIPVARPIDPRYVGLRDSAFDRIPGKDFLAVYGPLTEQLELWTYRAISWFTSNPIRQVFWFKVPYALCDLGVIAALWFWLRARGCPRERVLIYPWSPLPIMEFWGSGHNDSLALMLLALAFSYAARKRWTVGFAFLALAAASKIWPLFLVPLFIGWSGRRPLRTYQWWIMLPFSLCWRGRTAPMLRRISVS